MWIISRRNSINSRINDCAYPIRRTSIIQAKDVNEKKKKRRGVLLGGFHAFSTSAINFYLYYVLIKSTNEGIFTRMLLAEGLYVCIYTRTHSYELKKKPPLFYSYPSSPIVPSLSTNKIKCTRTPLLYISFASFFCFFFSQTWITIILKNNNNHI